MCPASHGRKVKVSECAGAPRVPQHWKAEHSYLDILVQGWRLEDLHRSGYVYVHWSEEQYDMSICACYPPALLFPDYFQGALRTPHWKTRRKWRQGKCHCRQTALSEVLKPDALRWRPASFAELASRCSASASSEQWVGNPAASWRVGTGSRQIRHSTALWPVSIGPSS